MLVSMFVRFADWSELYNTISCKVPSNICVFCPLLFAPIVKTLPLSKSRVVASLALAANVPFVYSKMLEPEPPYIRTETRVLLDLVNNSVSKKLAEPLSIILTSPDEFEYL